MASLPNLVTRINALISSHRQTIASIQRLQQASNPSSAASEDSWDPDAVLELVSDIQQSLKDQEEELEILQLDVDDLLPNTSNGSPIPGARWVGGGSTLRRNRDGERDSERDRIAAQVFKLSEDLKASRVSFRKAQLSAKRYADAQQARERAALFAPPPLPEQLSESNNGSSGRSTPHLHTRTTSRALAGGDRKQLTQDDLTLAVSSDVTNALRRTHHLLKSSVEQSQFAAETLASSSAALSTLSESYSSLDTMLASSKNLVGSLLRSHKSDTWYLETAFYICAVTLAWLVFRRWFYGPLWWLVWLPVKWTWWGATGLAAGVASSSQSAGMKVPGDVTKVLPSVHTSSAAGHAGVPTNDPAGGGWKHIPLPAKGAGWGRPAMPPQQPPPAQAQQDSESRMIDKIGEMAETSREQMDKAEYEGVDGEGQDRTAEKIEETVLLSPSESEDIPRNPKKRMWEEDRVQQRPRDEL